MKLKTMVKQQNEKETEHLVSDVSVDRLIDAGLLALSREMRNLLVMSASGKLPPADARDLRDTVKLLFDLKDREGDSLNSTSDEQLKEQARALINGDNQ